MRICFVLAIFLVVVQSRTGPFSKHTVIRITPTNEDEIRLLQTLTANTRFDIWKWPSNGSPHMDVRLTPHDARIFLPVLATHGLQYKTMINDVQRLVDSQTQDTVPPGSSAEFDYSKYHTLDEIFAWMENITSVYKDRASLFNVTSSYEGRPLMGLKISNPSSGAARPSFWIEGGIHAREWISPATVVFMAGQMLDLYKLDPELTAAVDRFDWYILPVTNPDGYTYTWKDQQSRLWRKTRSPQARGCTGVDPNRNWDYEWCKSGASKEPCSDTFCGPSAFSEVEVKGVADFVSNLKDLKGFIDVHSYSQLWMSPWGYTSKHPTDFKAQDEGSRVAVEALEKMYGTKYEHGNIAGILYEASGSSADFAYGKLGVKYSYAVELRDTGKHGFLLPEDQILPSGHETLEALKALANYVADN